MGARDAAGNDYAASQVDAGNAAGALGSYQGDIGDYMSNVNSAIAAGNPYESKDYLTKQNLATSGAMNSENDAANQQEQQTVARTGTNSAAMAADEAERARQGQRDLTNYNATRDTQNMDKWQAEKQGLMKDQLEGANSEAGIYNTSIGGQNSTLSSMTQADDAENQMWAGIAGAALGGAGLGAGIAMK